MNIFHIIEIIFIVLGGIGIFYALHQLEKTIFTPTICETKTPSMVYWLNHPHHKGEKWLMQFNKDTMCYGEKFKLTYEYYKFHTDEFEIINPDFQISWKAIKI